MVQNPKGLMCLIESVCPFDEVLLGIYCSPFDTIGPWLCDLVAPLFKNKGGGTKALGPRHLLNLSDNEQFIGEVRSPCYGDVCVSLVMVLNTEIGKHFCCNFNIPFLLL